jgi:Spy/CpxP family protein refolding chaperone
MKKILFLTLILGSIISTNVQAQGNAPANTPPDPAAMLQQMKEKQKPGLVEKAGLTDAQAEKVIELNFEMRMKASNELKDLNEADRATKMAELQAAKEKKFAEFLTPEQIKAMHTYYADMRKNMPKKSGN